MKHNPSKKPIKYGQSIWLDYFRRDLIESSNLERLIYEDGLRRMSTNSAAECERIYEKTGGKDGYISLEVDPHLAYDTKGTIDEARRLWALLGRKNVLIKVPATSESIPAIEQLVSEGINVNVTLIFGLRRYKEVAEAYISGLESRVARGQSVKHITSVASFFLNRIDTLVDPLLRKVFRSEGEKFEIAKKAHGQVSVLSAIVAYQVYKDIFGSERYTNLAHAGAHVQRLHWASTSTKNTKYSDTKYIEESIGPDTVNTVPLKTINAYRDHGDQKLRLEQDIAGANYTMAQLSELGMFIESLTVQLEDEGVRKFNEPFDSMTKSLKKRIAVEQRKG